MCANKLVKDYMTEDPIVVNLPGNRTEAINKMVKNKLTGMPVVKEGELRGFVTRKDFFDNPEENQLALIYRKNYPSLAQDDDIVEAAELFVKEDIHYIPVINKDDQCIGIITTADMLEYIESRKIETHVSDVTKHVCVPIYEGTPIKVALQMMKLTNLYAFPVVDEDTTLTGIITDRDLFNLTEVNGDIVISELGLGDDEDNWSWQGLKNIMKLYYEESKIELPEITVKEAMVEEPLAIYDQTTVSEAARLMRRNDYGQLPITDEMDRLEAMVYELDLVSTIV
ncbi:MAG: CBS domain-containing protein [Thermoplasmatota archaeon]